MQIIKIEHAIKLLNECFFLSLEAVKAFSKNTSWNIQKISLHIEYQTAEQIEKKSTDRAFQSFFTKFKK